MKGISVISCRNQQTIGQSAGSSALDTIISNCLTVHKMFTLISSSPKRIVQPEQKLCVFVELFRNIGLLASKPKGSTRHKSEGEGVEAD